MKSNLFIDGSIVVIAPYSPIGSCDLPHLGAAKKISAILNLLSMFGRPVVLINSAHNRNINSWGQVSQDVHGGKNITVVTPFTIWNRRLGKLCNLLGTSRLAHKINDCKPALVWIYNGYAFESKLALELHALCGCPIVLEVEDWHTARSRGLNPKPAFDLYYFKKILEKTTLITCVNELARAKVISICDETMLLPSLIDHRLVNKTNYKTPFIRGPFRIGYFGGLNFEKGADLILALGRELPPNWNLVVTGSGPLATEFESIAATMADRITFVNNATEVELYKEMLQCDAIVNPHSSITDMGNGVFPFKVFEALASGRLLISTTLPDAGISIDNSILFFDGSFSGLKIAIGQSKQFFEDHLLDIEITSAKVLQLYSEDAVFESLQRRLLQKNICIVAS
jgi:glycosyltransferase involved in cell wall biosynthesis